MGWFSSSRGGGWSAARLVNGGCHVCFICCRSSRLCLGSGVTWRANHRAPWRFLRLGPPRLAPRARLAPGSRVPVLPGRPLGRGCRVRACHRRLSWVARLGAAWGVAVGCCRSGGRLARALGGQGGAPAWHAGARRACPGVAAVPVAPRVGVIGLTRSSGPSGPGRSLSFRFRQQGPAASPPGSTFKR